MKDITIVWEPVRQRGDWAIANGALVIGNDLETAVLVSLFTDRVLPLDLTPPDGTTDRRGWWGDSYESAPIGSRLWTLRRKIKSNASSILQEAKSICLEALQWMLDDQVAASINVTTFWANAVQLVIITQIVEPDGTVSTFKYQWAWRFLAGAAPAPLPGSQYLETGGGAILETGGGAPILI
jgi:phage gp46-like protein